MIYIWLGISVLLSTLGIILLTLYLVRGTKSVGLFVLGLTLILLGVGCGFAGLAFNLS